MKDTLALRKTATVIALLMAGSALRAQVVSGTVIDSASRRPMPGVTILVQGVTDSSVRRGSISDSLGSFSIRLPREGAYTVSARRIGLHPIATEPRQVAALGSRVIRFEMSPLPIMLDTLRTEGHKYLKGTLYKLTAGQEWFARHYRAGKGFFTSGTEIMLSRLNACDYFGQIPGLMIVPMEIGGGAGALRCFDGTAFVTRYVVTRQRPSCLEAYVDHKFFVNALDTDEVGAASAFGGGEGLKSGSRWISMRNVRGIEVFTNLADIPKDFSMPMSASRRCALILVWTSQYWGAER